jgi:hypothetical protein
MGARMYGAFWCSHCFAQKETFGQEAYSQIAYIECAPDGLNSQTSLCKSRKVRAHAVLARKQPQARPSNT